MTAPHILTYLSDQQVKLHWIRIENMGAMWFYRWGVYISCPFEQYANYDRACWQN